MVSAPPKPPEGSVATLHCADCGKTLMQVFGMKPTQENTPIGVSKRCKCGYWNLIPLTVL